MSSVPPHLNPHTTAVASIGHCDVVPPRLLGTGQHHGCIGGDVTGIAPPRTESIGTGHNFPTGNYFSNKIAPHHTCTVKHFQLTQSSGCCCRCCCCCCGLTFNVDLRIHDLIFNDHIHSFFCCTGSNLFISQISVVWDTCVVRNVKSLITAHNTQTIKNKIQVSISTKSQYRQSVKVNLLQ